jgi:hypothetical protein
MDTDERREKLERGLAELTELNEEQRVAARQGAVAAVERYMERWADEDWQGLVEETQLSWRDLWEEKVSDDTPQPQDPRLMGEGTSPEGPSWKDATGGSVANMLGQLVGSEEVVLYEVRADDVQVRGPVLVDVPVEAVVRDRVGQRRRVLMQASVLCESGPYEPDPDGEWGVNPTSLRRQRATS